MKKKSIGELVNRIREERGITQKQLCDGLCSVQTLSNIESGERMPDVFLVEYLLQRLGISPDKLETVLFDNEYCEIELRDSIEEKLERGQLEEAEKELEAGYKTDKDGIRGQYYYQIKAILADAHHNHEKSLEYIKTALACTHFKPDLLSTREIELLCMMAEEYRLVNNRTEAKKIVTFLSNYLENPSIQEIELVKTYPKMAYLFAVLTNSKKEKMESISKCEKAFQLLITRDSTVFLVEIMELLTEGYQEMGLTNKVIRLQKQLESLEALYEDYGEWPYVTQESMKWFKESYRKEYLLCEEMIKGERLAKGIKRSELVEGIYEDLETLVRIENGNQSPSYKKYQLLMKRLNLPAEKYTGSPISDEDAISQAKNRITQHLIKHDYEEAKEELEKMKLILQEEDYISRQYVDKEEAYLEYKMEQIDAKTFMEKIRNVLVRTYSGDLENPLRIPTLEEAYIFNYLSLSYRKCGMQDESFHLYRKLLDCYKKSKISERYHYKTLTILHRNYLLLLEELNCCNEALITAEEVMGFELSASRGHGLDYICSEIMCIYEKAEMDEETKKKAIEKYLRLAFYLSDLFSRDVNNRIADHYYRENIDRNVIWYQ